MFLWLSVIDKKVAHPNEIQNTFVLYQGTKQGICYEGNINIIPSYEGNKYELNKCYFYVRG